MGPVPLIRRLKAPGGDLGEEPALPGPAYMGEEEQSEVEYVWLGQLYNYFGIKGGFETLDMVRPPCALQCFAAYSRLTSTLVA